MALTEQTQKRNMPEIKDIQVNVRWDDDVVHIALVGEAGLQNADRVERAFLPVVASKPRLVIVNLEELDFIGSLGLGMLVELQRSLKLSGGTLRLACAQDVIIDVIKRCRLERVLTVHDTVEEALAAS